MFAQVLVRDALVQRFGENHQCICDEGGESLVIDVTTLHILLMMVALLICLNCCDDTTTMHKYVHVNIGW